MKILVCMDVNENHKEILNEATQGGTIDVDMNTGYRKS